MVPQELADAAVNIVSYYAISRTFKSVANKLVSTGKLLPETIRTFLKNSSVADKVGTVGFDVVKNGHLDPKMSTVYNKFYKGVDVIGTTLGSILSCNIVTPIIRNEIAANKQKNVLQKWIKKLQKLIFQISEIIRKTLHIYQNLLCRLFKLHIWQDRLLLI